MIPVVLAELLEASQESVNIRPRSGMAHMF